MTKELIAGFEQFKKRQYESDGGIMLRLIAEGQKPDYMIISCIDSRTNPGTIFQAPPGTFFGHKAMGAIVRPYQQGTALSATLQFAIRYNDVRKIIILGHTGCGAIRALIENMQDDEISSFIKLARTSLDKARQSCANPDDIQELQRKTEEEIVLQSAKNLETYPAVRAALDAGTMTIMPWLFCMEEGALYGYQDSSGAFEKITGADDAAPFATGCCHA